MSMDSSAGRSPRRVALEVAALGVLVALAVLLAKGTESETPEDTPPETVAEPETVETPTPATVAIPSDPAEWAAMSHDDLEAVGRHVAETTPGFRFDRVEVFSGGGLSNAIAVLVHEKTELEFSLIPPGRFEMGCVEEGALNANEVPVHTVTISQAFLFSRTECSEAAWKAGGGDAARDALGPAHAIANVKWTEARSYCDGLRLRLPSEAEWEYACRARTTTWFWSGNDEADLARVGWYGGGMRGGNSATHVHPVGEKPANPFGLFDVHGNAWEWCEDTFHWDYDGAPVDGSAWIAGGTNERVLRGGCVCFLAHLAHSAARFRYFPNNVWANSFGFRPAATVGGER